MYSLECQIIEFDSRIDVKRCDLSGFKVLPTLKDCPPVIFCDQSILGGVGLNIQPVTVSELQETLKLKIESKGDLYKATSKAGLQEFPNGLPYLMCASKWGTIKNMLTKKNTPYHILVKPFMYGFQDGATLSLLKDEDDSVCLTVNSGFPSAVDPDDIWWTVKKIEVFKPNVVNLVLKSELA